MSITKHLNKEHPNISSRDMSLVTREGTSLRAFHDWWHEEYAENPSTTHTHDPHGQVIFHDRRGDQ